MITCAFACLDEERGVKRRIRLLSEEVVLNFCTSAQPCLLQPVGAHPEVRTECMPPVLPRVRQGYWLHQGVHLSLSVGCKPAYLDHVQLSIASIIAALDHLLWDMCPCAEWHPTACMGCAAHICICSLWEACCSLCETGASNIKVKTRALALLCSTVERLRSSIDLTASRSHA